MKTKKVLPLVSLLFVAIMFLSVGMIAKEYRERQQDIKGFEKLADIITEAEQTEMTEFKSRSLYDTEIEQQYKEQLLTLSTCFGDSKDSRIIVIGVEQIR